MRIMKPVVEYSSQLIIELKKSMAAPMMLLFRIRGLKQVFSYLSLFFLCVTFSVKWVLQGGSS
jgi:hypothetical protein